MVSSSAEYAQVTRMLGNGRLEAFCFDGVNRLCHIRGKLRKRVWIGVGDIVLLGLREFQDQKCVRAAARTLDRPRASGRSPRVVKTGRAAALSLPPRPLLRCTGRTSS